jgi:hypothetical protein
MRLPVAEARSTPVYAGWQLEHVSTDTRSAVVRTAWTVPQVEQTASIRFR